MNIKCYLNESKLYDLLQFPRLLYIKYSESMNEGYHYTALELKDLNDDRYINFIKSAQSKLETYRDSINPFYADAFMCDYDYFELLTKIYPIEGYKTIEKYLLDITKKDNDTFKIDLITSLLIIEAEADFDTYDSKRSLAETLSKDQSALMAFVKDIATEADYKWHIMMMLDNPKDTLNIYIELMRSIEPLFLSFYQEHESAIKTVANEITEAFNQQDSQKVKALTHNMVDHTFFTEKTNKFLISFTFPYAFIFKKDYQSAYIIWGLNMEKGFKKLSENYHNELNKRTQVFKNLGDVTRYEVLKLIASGITSTKAIAETLNVSSATISYHINAFITSRVITISKTKGVKYDVNFDLLASVFKQCIEDLKAIKN